LEVQILEVEEVTQNHFRQIRAFWNQFQVKLPSGRKQFLHVYITFPQTLRLLNDDIICIT